MSCVPTEPIPVVTETTDDAVLGGRLRLRQPRRGHRVGHDAMLLAAATGGRDGEHAVELGAGVGAAGLALAVRVAGLRVTLVERDAALTALAAENAGRNGVAQRVRTVTLDVAAPAREFAAAGLPAGSVQRVLMNPPFNDPGRHRLSPDADRRAAHAGSPETLPQWLRVAFRLLDAHGIVTLIWRADDIGRVLGWVESRQGGIVVLPIYPSPGAAATRVLVRLRKGSRAPLEILPGLILSDANGRVSDAAEAVLRHGGLLPLAE
jgi:tRNA1(Val) A37 N6-methylase TrmN6